MPKPTEKSPAINKLLDEISPSPKGRVESIEGNICTWCQGPADEFTDELSKKEYTLSGFCQSCQNKTFGSPV